MSLRKKKNGFQSLHFQEKALLCHRFDKVEVCRLCLWACNGVRLARKCPSPWTVVVAAWCWKRGRGLGLELAVMLKRQQPPTKHYNFDKTNLNIGIFET
jgi:hypothetical protein